MPQSGTGNDSVPGSPSEEKEVQFVDFVQGDAQDFWTQQFQAAGRPYQRAKVVLFSNQVRSGCGLASSATGPFYCPLDQKVYLDLGFFNELNQRFKAPGDFAQAYVIAHELGHHIQQSSASTSSSSSASSSRFGSRANPIRTTRTSSQCASSCRPTASPASGPARPTTAASSRAATSRRA